MKVYVDIARLSNSHIQEIASFSTDKKTIRRIAKAFRLDKGIATAIIDNPNTSIHVLKYLARTRLLNISGYAKQKLNERKRCKK